MKIEKISLSNLNSLYGNWEIDLTHPDYEASGIFAIVGSTGAGKSSILDAICLALYGQTPRLGKITQSSNEIMSRHCGYCRAEVHFMAEGKRYRATWMQQRARKKTDGPLQAANHILAEADSNRIIKDKVSEVPAEIEQISGMDFKRFTRSMLLAQGDFAAFLLANDNERAEILEKITGTDLYRKVSIAAFKRHSDEKNNLELLEAEIKGIKLLEQEEKHLLQQELDGLNKELGGIEAELKTTQASCDWYIMRKKLETEQRQISAGLQELQQDLQGFVSSQLKLEAAQRAADLAADYADLQNLRRQKTENAKEWQACQESLPKLQEGLTKVNTEKIRVEQGMEELKKQSENLRPVLRAVQKLDNQIQLEQRQVDAEAKKTKQVELDLQAEIKNKNGLKLDKEKLESKQQSNTQALLDTQADQALENGGLERIAELFANLQKNESRLKQAETASRSAAQEHEKATKALSDVEKMQEADNKKAAQHQEELKQVEAEVSKLLADTPLAAHKTELEHLREKAELQRLLLSMEEQRSKLVDGEPCPLCGAIEHPYARGNMPALDEIEEQLQVKRKLIADIERSQEKQEEIRKKHDAVATSVQKTQQKVHEAKLLCSKTENALENAKKDAASGQEACGEAKKNIVHALLPLGIGDKINLQADELLKQLGKRLENRRQLLKDQEDLGKKINEQAGKIETSEKLSQVKDKALQEAKSALKERETELQQLKKERADMFGSKDPGKEEQKLLDETREKEKSQKKLEQDLKKIEDKKLVCEEKIKQLHLKSEDIEAKLAQAIPAFNSALQDKGFADEDQFVQSILPQEERERLNNAAEALKVRKITLQNRKQSNEDSLTEHMSTPPADQDEPAAIARLAEVKEKQSKINQRLGGIKERLEQDQIAQSGVQDKHKLRDRQYAIVQDWQMLSELIGSADGKKYTRFAQGLTFDVLIRQANQKLRLLNNRYLLKRVPGQLALDVIDTYQAGELRTTKNLSGGESFIVSLALALGLAEMVSEKVQVDSLFLDEGFGTLDEEALETALSTLSALRQDNKLIGVISHVQGIKDSISCQIQVIKQAGGRSILKGPGCQQGSDNKD
ncbi:MAG: AAA family ATPase [Oligosphaeraceae bacterium]|nr:AAA family ATPase [Oligosphaeraceae bacterium]